MDRSNTLDPRQPSDGFTAKAVLNTRVADERAILDEELIRARHALAYLNGKIGSAAMRDLLAGDLARTTIRFRTRMASCIYTSGCVLPIGRSTDGSDLLRQSMPAT